MNDVHDFDQSHKNFIEEISNATFILDDVQHVEAHKRVNSSLNMPLEMEEVVGNGRFRI